MIVEFCQTKPSKVRNVGWLLSGNRKSALIQHINLFLGLHVFLYFGLDMMITEMVKRCII